MAGLCINIRSTLSNFWFRPSIWRIFKSKPRLYNLDSNKLRISFWAAMTMAGFCVNIRSMLSNSWFKPSTWRIRANLIHLPFSNLRISFWTAVTMAGLCVNIRSMLRSFWFKPSTWRIRANQIHLPLILVTLGLASEQQWRWPAFALTSGQCWAISDGSGRLENWSWQITRALGYPLCAVCQQTNDSNTVIQWCAKEIVLF